MKDFALRNDTKLLFRNDPVADLTELTAGQKSAVFLRRRFCKKERLL